MNYVSTKVEKTRVPPLLRERSYFRRKIIRIIRKQKLIMYFNSVCLLGRLTAHIVTKFYFYFFSHEALSVCKKRSYLQRQCQISKHA